MKGVKGMNGDRDRVRSPVFRRFGTWHETKAA